MLESVCEPIDDPLVEVIATQVRVTIRREHLKDAFAELQDGDIERPATQVKDGDLLVALLLEPVGQGGRGRLIDNALHIQAGDLAGILGGLSLRVIEVGGDGDYGFGHLFAKVILRGLPHLLEDHGRDFGRGIDLVLDLDGRIAIAAINHLVRHEFNLFTHLALPTANKAFDAEDGVGGVRNGLALRRNADQAFAVLRESNAGGGRSPAFAIRNDNWLAAFHHRNARVRRTQVDSDDLSHLVCLRGVVSLKANLQKSRVAQLYQQTASRSRLSLPCWGTDRRVPQHKPSGRSRYASGRA